MTRKDKWFMAIAVSTSVFLFSFVFWLGFPGFFQCRDIYDSLSVTTNHWHPVIIARSLQCLYSFFGRHSFYLFALNIFCFYAGTLLFVLALYLRTRNLLWYALFATTAIGNMFFQNFVQLTSFGFSMLLWLGCSMVFFQILVDMKNTRAAFAAKIATAIVFLFALLWRHNAVLSVYPLLILFVYILLKKKEAHKGAAYIARFAFLMLACACALAFMVKAYPHLLSDNECKGPANHIFLHQIAGMVVPADDRTFIPQEWYEKGKGFNDLVEMYGKYPTYADVFNGGFNPSDPQRVFVPGEIKGLKALWFKGILTYPANCLRHLSRFFRKMWFQEPTMILTLDHMQRAPVDPYRLSIVTEFPENERHVSFTPLQERIYGFLFGHKVLLNHVVGVATGFLVLFASGCVWIMVPRGRGELLLFAASTSLSSCCTAIGVCIFSPATASRYMSPVLVLSLISLIGLAAWCALVSGNKNEPPRQSSAMAVPSRLSK